MEDDRLDLKVTPTTIILVLAPILIVLYFLEAWWALVIVIALSIVAVFLFWHREEKGLTFIIFSIIGMLLIVFVLLPISELLYSAIPDLDRAVSDPQAISAIGVSISAALVATAIGLLLGIPLSYVLARRTFPAKQLVEGVVDLPMVVPHTVAGIALLVVFGRHGTIGEPLGLLGINFVDAFPGIVVAMMFVSIPFVVNQVREGFEAVDPRLEKVAMSLGAGGRTVFTTISLPLVKRNLISGGLMAWARAISEFGAVVIIAYFPLSAPVYIYEMFTSHGLLAARPVAALLLLVSLTAFIVIRTLTRKIGIYAKD
jgi:molybdate/tungstate transport system permease protein